MVHAGMRFSTMVMDESPLACDFMLNGDCRYVYEYHKVLLQLLTKKYQLMHNKQVRWVLKCPFHSFYMQELTDQYPDALFIQTHRNPVQVLPSVASLSLKSSSFLLTRNNTRALGLRVTKWWRCAMDRLVKVRENSLSSKFIDISYNNLLRSPIETVKEIYTYFNLEYSAEFEDRMKVWLANNPQNKKGVHKYTLEEFGLTKEFIDEEFHSYNQKFAAFL